MSNADCTWPHHPHDAETVAAHALRAHERTWSLVCGDHDPDDRGTIKNCWTVDVPTPSRYTDGCVYLSQITLCFYDDEAEARLAAQAPAMARAMLAFVEQEFDAPHPMTPEERGEHAEAMRAVLRAAGVLPCP